MDKLIIVMPVYNEEENIQNVIDDWYPVVEKIGNDSKIIIVNDGSTDNTEKILAENSNLKEHLFFHTKPNSGHGPSVTLAYKLALRENPDYIFQIDSDGQVLVSDFERFWKHRNDYDVIIGYRKNRQDGFGRIVVTKTLKALIKVVFGCSVTDANTPFRLMHSDVLRKYINKIPEDYNLPNVILSTMFVKNKENVKFAKITFKPRAAGENKLKVKKIFKIGLKSIKDFYNFKKVI